MSSRANRSVITLWGLVASIGLLSLTTRGVGDPPAADSKPAAPTQPKPAPAAKPTSKAPAKPQGPARKPARAAPQPTADSTVQKALAEPAELDFDQTSLKDVLEAIGIRHRINIILDEKSFNDASIPFETPITINVKGVSLRSALRLMLQQHSLNYLLDDGIDNVLIITTDARAKEHLVSVRLFDVHELSPAAQYLPADPEYDEIVEVITGTIAPQTWTSAGGSGSVTFGDMLVVAQTDEVQAMIPHCSPPLETASSSNNRRQRFCPSNPRRIRHTGRRAPSPTRRANRRRFRSNFAH